MSLPAADLDPARRLLAFCDASPSPYHACATAAALLGEAGFTRLAEDAAWPGEPGRWFVVRGGTLVAWATAAGHKPHDGFRIVGAHTDSPNLRVKPQPDVVRAGVRQIGVEAYGGVLLTSWMNRDLGLSGRVAVRRNGTGAMVRLLRVDRPVCAIPQLAIHLDREVNTAGPARRRPAPPHPAVGHRAACGGDAQRGHRHGRVRRVRRPRAGGRRRPTCSAGT